MATRQAAAPVVESLSFRLDNFTGGAGLQDGRYLLEKCDAHLFDYQGKRPDLPAQPAFRGFFRPITVDSKGVITPAGELVEQEYTAGSAEAIGVNPEGTGFIALGARTTFGKSSNFYIFLENLVAAGVPEDFFNNDVTVFEGIAMDIVNIPAPERNLPESNLVQAGPVKKNNFPKTVAVPKVIGKMPDQERWGGGGSTKAPAAPATKAPAATAQKHTPAPTAAIPEGGIDEQATEFIKQVLGDNTSMQRSALRVAVYKATGAAGLSNDVRKEINNIFTNDEQLSAVLMGVGEVGFEIRGADVAAIG